MGTAAVTSKVLEFVTIVKVDGYTGSLAELARRTERELVRRIDDDGIAAIQQYFVRSIASGIQIGLRFRGLKAGEVEATGSDVVKEATQAALLAEGQESHAGRITNTLLAGV